MWILILAKKMVCILAPKGNAPRKLFLNNPRVKPSPDIVLTKVSLKTLLTRHFQLGISIGSTFLWALGAESITATCPAYEDVF